MDDAKVLARLSEYGVELPPTPAALASYVTCVVSGSTATVAGQVPIVDGVLQHPGHLGSDVRLEDGAEAARRAALQTLSVLRDALGGSFERLVRIVQVTVYVAATPDFVDHPKVANGASDFLAEVLGDEGRHARVAVGVSSLPLGACVEVSLIAEIDPA